VYKRIAFLITHIAYTIMCDLFLKLIHDSGQSKVPCRWSAEERAGNFVEVLIRGSTTTHSNINDFQTGRLRFHDFSCLFFTLLVPFLPLFITFFQLDVMDGNHVEGCEGAGRL